MSNMLFVGSNQPNTSIRLQRKAHISSLSLSLQYNVRDMTSTKFWTYPCGKVIKVMNCSLTAIFFEQSFLLKSFAVQTRSLRLWPHVSLKQHGEVSSFSVMKSVQISFTNCLTEINIPCLVSKNNEKSRCRNELTPYKSDELKICSWFALKFIQFWKVDNFSVPYDLTSRWRFRMVAFAE